MSKFWKINLYINLLLIIAYITILIGIYYDTHFMPNFLYSLPILLPYIAFSLLVIQIISLLTRLFLKKNNKYSWLCIICSTLTLFSGLIILFIGAGSLG